MMQCIREHPIGINTIRSFEGGNGDRKNKTDHAQIFIGSIHPQSSPLDLNSLEANVRTKRKVETWIHAHRYGDLRSRPCISSFFLWIPSSAFFCRSTSDAFGATGSRLVGDAV